MPATQALGITHVCGPYIGAGQKLSYLKGEVAVVKPAGCATVNTWVLMLT